jgi:hypothetical protein
MRVTFDSQVWQQMVFPERHIKHPDHGLMVRIKDALRGDRMQGFICESFGTLEAIANKERAAFLANKIPIVKTQATNLGEGNVSISITIESDHSRHPGLHPKLEKELEEAIAIGMRLLSTPYFNLPVPSRLLNDPAIYAPEVFASADYNERFGSAVSTIVTRGVGQAVLAALVKKIAQRLEAHRPTVKWDIQLLEYAYTHSKDQAERKGIEKAVAESADGDAVAAHIAFGNEFLCSEDQGKTARGPSIFNAENRAWLKAAYGVTFVNMKELVAIPA